MKKSNWKLILIIVAGIRAEFTEQSFFTGGAGEYS